MNKNILFMFLAIFCFMANAQDEPTNGSDISFGLKGGLNFAMIAGDDTDDFDGRIAFHIGAVTEIPISDKFSFQPELLYSSQGDKMSIDGMDIDFKFDYLNLPLLAKYYVAEGFSLEAGPQIGFLLSSKVEGNGVSIDIKDVIKGIDFGFDFGLGYKLENGINFAARYHLGISNIVEDNGTILGEEIDASDTKNYNNVFQISVGYFFL
jgi:hypothetical protein